MDTVEKKSGSGFKNLPFLQLGKADRLLPSALLSLTIIYVEKDLSDC